MPRISETNKVPKCNLYTKLRKQAKRLIADDGVYIYGECAGLCNEIIEEESPRVETFGLWEELSKPKEIHDSLDQYMIGQGAAKKAFTIVVYNHYRHITSEQTHIGRSCQNEEPVEVGKLDILLIGPTGCGKTYLARILAKMLSMPFVMIDATTLTEAGYAGEDVENILLRLIQAVDFDIKKAETGIIYVDEIDKVARKSEDPSITRDVLGEGVQQALLRILEETVASVPPRGRRECLHRDFLQIDTTRVLFTVGGVFAGPDEIINSCIRKRPLGFSVDTSAWKGVTGPLSEVRPENLHEFGLIPEFIKCLPMISTISPLDREVLNRILVGPRSALAKQSVRLFEFDGVQLDLIDEAIDAVVEPVLERGTEAHGLRVILEGLLPDAMFEVPSAEDVVQVVVTREVVPGEAQPESVASSRVTRHWDLSA